MIIKKKQDSTMSDFSSTLLSSSLSPSLSPSLSSSLSPFISKLTLSDMSDSSPSLLHPPPSFSPPSFSPPSFSPPSFSPSSFSPPSLPLDLITNINSTNVVSDSPSLPLFSALDSVALLGSDISNVNSTTVVSDSPSPPPLDSNINVEPTNEPTSESIRSIFFSNLNEEVSKKGPYDSFKTRESSSKLKVSTSNRRNSTRNSLAKKYVCGACIFSNDGKSCILVKQKTANKWGFPKGSKDKIDSDDMECMKRELLEETSIRLENCDYTIIRENKKENSHLFFIHMHTFIPLKDLVPIDSNEISTATWMPLSNIPKLELNSITRDTWNNLLCNKSLQDLYSVNHSLPKRSYKVNNQPTNNLYTINQQSLNQRNFNTTRSDPILIPISNPNPKSTFYSSSFTSLPPLNLFSSNSYSTNSSSYHKKHILNHRYNPEYKPEYKPEYNPECYSSSVINC